MSGPRSPILASLALSALCLSCGLFAEGAQAVVSYEFAFTGQFASPRGVAVNNETGDVYVADTGNSRIQQFDADGNFIRMWGKGVNADTGGDICPVAPGDTCQAASPGAVGGAFSVPTGIAVDNSNGPAEGHVYVQDAANNRIQEFTGEGQFLVAWGKAVNLNDGGNFCTAASGDTCKAGNKSGVKGKPEGPNGELPISDLPSGPGEFGGWEKHPAPNIAVDGLGFVYVGDPEAIPFPRVQKFAPGGAFLGAVGPPNNLTGGRGIQAGLSLAADADGDVFVADFNRIVEFKAATFDSGGGDEYDNAFAFRTSPRLAAFDPSNGFLLVNDTGPACSESGPAASHIREYSLSGQVADCTVPLAPPIADLAAMAASAQHRLYAAVGSQILVFGLPVAGAPDVSNSAVAHVTSKSAVIEARVAGNLDPTTVQVEFGTEPCGPGVCATTAAADQIGSAVFPVPASVSLGDLVPGQEYHYRVVAANTKGSDTGIEGTFSTYPAPQFDPSCQNNLARQQTRAAFLLDCRAYELVSAEDTGGYNVESDLIPGEEPFPGFPQATGKALYAVHDGGIPGTGKPTNRGRDPYVSTRDATQGRWTTEYVGVPVDAPSLSPFSSVPTGVDSALGTFAFGGGEICDPCFSDGAAGIPLRLEDGSLVQGMVGSLPVGDPVPAGEVRKPVSGDGSHFVFGSLQQFEPGGNPEDGNVTIYERNLGDGTTQVVSTDELGSTLAGGMDVAQLDISDDGSRVLIGDLVRTDPDGRRYWHLYMHVGAAAASVDLTPEVPNGAAYAGMSSDGAAVYFSTADELAGESDESVDLFRADVGTASASIARVSTGLGPAGDTDACDPAENSATFHWNAPRGSEPDCSVVAIGGGGGVASEADGGVFFLSPEELDTSGPAQPQQDAPNLYFSRPGQPPKFVATLESALNRAPDSPYLYEVNEGFAGFTRVTGLAVDEPNGNFYAFDNGPGAGKVVKKFNTDGNPVQFTAGSGAGTNQLNGSDAPAGAFAPNIVQPTGLAVDQSNGNLHVADYGHNRVDVFHSTGQYDSEFTVTAPTGVAIHPVTGAVYVASQSTNKIVIFPPGGGPSSSFSVISAPSGVAVDSTGRVYVVNGSQTAVYSAAGTFISTLVSGTSTGVAIDPITDDVFVNRGTSVVQFDSSGKQIGGVDGEGTPIGSGVISGSRPTAFDSSSGDLYVSNNNVAIRHFRRTVKPEGRVDNPAVLNSVAAPETRRSADLQVTPSGDHAILPSTLSLDGGIPDGTGVEQLYRYDSTAGTLACVSCNPTGAIPTTDASLSTAGLNITDDGRVFFDTGEALVLRDTGSKRDAYEWSDGRIELISTGQSSVDSGLLTVTHDGVDAFFFTRETLTANDRNGSLMKLYDAREEGGFFVIPPPPSCAASDECHGPGSPRPPAPGINTDTGSGGNMRAGRRPCRRGKVRRNGRCAKPKKPTKRNRNGRRPGASRGSSS